MQRSTTTLFFIINTREPDAVPSKEGRSEGTKMARLNGLISNMSGSAGNLNFRRREGMTIVSEKVTEVKNPRTSAQQQTRMKWGNIIQMYKGLRPLLDYGFESRSKGVSDYNMFVKVNMLQTPVYLTKAEVAGGTCIVAPYQITQGSLPAIVVTGEGYSKKTDISLGSLTIDASTTVAEFSNAVVQNNAAFNYGDQISYFIAHQLVNAATQIPYAQFAGFAVILDKQNPATLWSMVNKAGFATMDGFLGHNTDEGDCGFCWVHSRKNGSKRLISTQQFIVHNSMLDAYLGADAYSRAVNTYGGENGVFLMPNGTTNTAGGNNGSTTGGSSTGSGSGTNTNRQYTISVSSANTEQGTVSGGGTYSEGSRITVTATPKAGYSFLAWSDGVTTASRNITVSQNLTLTAIFKTATSGDGGEEGDNGEKFI